MRLKKTASSKANLILKKSEWEAIGKQAGWKKSASMAEHTLEDVEIYVGGEVKSFEIVFGFVSTSIKGNRRGHPDRWTPDEYDEDYEIKEIAEVDVVRGKDGKFISVRKSGNLLGSLDSEVMKQIENIVQEWISKNGSSAYSDYMQNSIDSVIDEEQVDRMMGI